MEKKIKFNKWMWRLPFLVILVVGSVYIIRKETGAPYQKDSGFVFGTLYNITYQSEYSIKAEIEAEMSKVDNSLSPYNPKSIITAINNNEDVTLNTMFTDVFNIAHQVADETNGDFDITVAPLVNAWGFGFKHNITPDSTTIDSLRQFVGYKTVKIAHNKLIKEHPNTMLDCSSIAKGYGVDAVAHLLDRKGIRNYMVEIGGEVVTRGKSPKHTSWRIGINKPVEDSISVVNELQDIVNLNNEAMATSGNYRNFYYKDGRKYAHTINPHTGYPVFHNLLSATVIAKNCTIADAYATSFMVMGMDKAKKFLEKHPELAVFFIYVDKEGKNQTYYSHSLKDRIVK